MNDSNIANILEQQTVNSSEEVEKKVLSSILQSKTAAGTAISQLNQDHFWEFPLNKVIFMAIKHCAEAGIDIEPVAVTEILFKKYSHYTGDESREYINQLMQLSSIDDITWHCTFIREKAVLNNLRNSCIDIIHKIPTVEHAEEAITIAQEAIFSISGETTVEDRLYKADKAAQEVFDDIIGRLDTPEATQGIESGYPMIDEMTGGWQPQDLVIIAGRPSMGKTAFALGTLESMLQKGIGCIMFSLEMSRKQIINRLISSLSGIENKDLMAANLTNPQLTAFNSVIDKIKEFPLHIEESSDQTPASMRMAIHRAKLENPNLKIIMIDYIGLMSSGVHKGHDNRVQEVSYISRKLKGLAKEFDMTVIALSQLNRGVETRNDKRPLLSDIRDSGSIEQDADIVAFLYRDKYYDKNSEMGDTGEFIIGKQRNGRVGTVNLLFVEKYAQYLHMNPPRRSL